MANLTKQKLRTQVLHSRAKRAEVGSDQSAKEYLKHDWTSFIVGQKVGCFASLPDEPNTFELRTHLAKLGYELFLPILAPGNSLIWAADLPPYEVNKFGIEQPASTDKDSVVATSALTTIIIPALAVDRLGNRLGRGGGFYDRTLAGLPKFAQGGPRRISLVFDDEVFDSLPTESHDCPVDLIVTPSRFIEVSS